MSEEVVDLLELVQVEQKKGGGLALFEEARKLGVEAPTVGEPGELIVRCLVEALFELAFEFCLVAGSLGLERLLLFSQGFESELQVGYVEHHAVDRDRVAGGISDERRLLPYVHDASIGCAHPVLEVEWTRGR